MSPAAPNALSARPAREASTALRTALTMMAAGAFMRTFLFAVLLLPIAAPVGAETRSFGIASFEKVRVDGPFKVRLTTGVAPFATATGSPAAVARGGDEGWGR